MTQATPTYGSFYGPYAGVVLDLDNLASALGNNIWPLNVLLQVVDNI